ncbi:SAV_915 family protein [Streptomyces sp. S6]
MRTVSASRLLDYLKEAPAAPAPTAPRRSCLLDYDLPPLHTPVLVPAHPRYTDGAPRIVCELFAHPDDGPVALAFTTPRKLVAALGEAQPWVATSLGALLTGLRGVRVRLDPSAASPHWTPADLAAYAGAVR